MSSYSQTTHPTDLPAEIEVTLLLDGGQQYTIDIESDNPLLRQLFEVLVDLEGNRVKRLFQIPIHKGRAVLTFPCDRLVGLITEPPLILQQDLDELMPTQLPAQIATPRLPTPTAPKVLVDRDPLVSDFIQLDNFFTPEEHKALLKYVFAHESDFVATSTSTGDAQYRKSSVLYAFPEFSALITQRIQEILPDLLVNYGLPPFQPSQIEAQLTAHNDGNYYKVHNDNGSTDTATRELTYVYYFNREPKAYKGGELRIYDSKIENNFYQQAETFKTVEPRNNSIVFFLSRYMHEVMPIRCPSRKFKDSRFTINGWVRK